MILVLSCPGCGKRYELNGTLAGKWVRCTQCRRDFKVPVPRPVTRPAAPKAPAAPRPRDVYGLDEAPPPVPPRGATRPTFHAFDDIDGPAVFRPAPASVDEDLPPPPRIGARTPKPKKSNTRGRSEGPGVGAIVGIIGALGGLLVVGLVLAALTGLVSPTQAGYTAGVLVVPGCLALMALGGLWLLIVAFREDPLQGILILFVPFYSLYYVLTRWEDAKRPFTVSMCGAGGLFLMLALALGVGALAGMGESSEAGSSGHVEMTRDPGQERRVLP